MTWRGDSREEMVGRLYLDRDTQDRLLAGRIDPDDAPPGYADVATFLQTLHLPVPRPDPGATARTIEAMARVLEDRTDDPRAPRRRRRLVASITVLALATSLAGTTGAAFAGALPDPAQRFVARLLATFGVSVPDPSRGGPGPGDADTEDPKPVAQPTQSPKPRDGRQSPTENSRDSDQHVRDLAPAREPDRHESDNPASGADRPEDLVSDLPLGDPAAASEGRAGEAADAIDAAGERRADAGQGVESAPQQIPGPEERGRS